MPSRWKKKGERCVCEGGGRLTPGTRDSSLTCIHRATQERRGLLSRLRAKEVSLVSISCLVTCSCSNEGGGEREREGRKNMCRMDTASKQKWYMSTVLHVVLEHVHVLYSLQEDKDGDPNPSQRWACAHELHIFVFLKLAIGHHV